MTMFRHLSRGVTVAAAACACTLSGTAFADSTQVTLDTVLVQGSLAYPVGIFHAPGDCRHLYIIQKTGMIRVLNLQTGVIGNFGLVSNVPTNSSIADERGLLGLAFHPDYQNNGYLYVHFTNISGNTVVRRYTANSPTSMDTSSAQTVMTVTQPFGNHNGGWIEFSPIDGYLYIGLGDGGSAGDPGNRAQNLGNPLGKIWRIDVDGDDFPGDPNRNYAIPSDNPFVSVPGALNEIWAFGLRNPWRCAFDRETGDLYIGDVGQNAREEINFQPASSPGGENYGWKCREGSASYSPAHCPADLTTLVNPVYEYTHATGQCITGGRVYRGSAIPGMQGAYIGADYLSNFSFSWRINETAPGVYATSEFKNRSPEMQPSAGGILNRMASFGEDYYGNIYVARQSSATISQVFRIFEAGESPQLFWPDLNGDCSVDSADLLELLSNWGPCPGCPADINGDGVVDSTDLLILLSNWS